MDKETVKDGGNDERESGKKILNSMNYNANGSTDGDKNGSSAQRGDIVDVSSAETGLSVEKEVFDYYGSNIGEMVVSNFGEKEWLAVIDDTLRIMNLGHNSVGNLRERGELTKDAEESYLLLRGYGIDAKDLTIGEMLMVLNYASDGTEEVRIQKAERLYDTLNRHINAVQSRHDGLEPAFYDLEEAERKESLRDKYLAWERGELDTERGFDVDAAYDKAIENGHSASSFLRRHLEEEEFQDLYDEGLVDTGMCFKYGPFTKEDIEDMHVYEEETWTDVVNFRYLKTPSKATGRSLSELLDETIVAGETSPEAGLVYDFVASEVLQDHRLKAKELLMASSAVALDSLKIEGVEGKRQEKEFRSLRNSVSFVSYYLGKIFGRSTTEMKERFGSSRPISGVFLSEMIEEIKGLSPARVEYIEESFKPILTKLDEHFRNILNNKVTINEKSSVMDDYSEELD